MQSLSQAVMLFQKGFQAFRGICNDWEVQMATKLEIAQIVVYLSAAYPRQAVSDATITVWADQFAETDAELLLIAARNHVAESVYFPVVAELKRGAEAVYNGRSFWGATRNSQFEDMPSHLCLPDSLRREFLLPAAAPVHRLNGTH